MTKICKASFALALAAAAGGALSQAALTREQVKADLAEATRTGEIIGNGETGQKRNELNPGSHPAKPVLQGKTRTQVRAELAEAQRTGDIIVIHETGMKANELWPGLYPTRTRQTAPAQATTTLSEVPPAR
jgi:Domain of unknown function (DUF4148)